MESISLAYFHDQVLSMRKQLEGGLSFQKNGDGVSSVYFLMHYSFRYSKRQRDTYK